MIKLIIFDLDGVLVDAKTVHFDALNTALGDDYQISWNSHLGIYDGLKTTQKLEILTEKKGLPVELYEEIWNKKQTVTLSILSKLPRNPELVAVLKRLSEENYQIACCSNSIRKTVLIVLSKLGLIEYMDLIMSNEDVVNSKPHPEMFWKTISKMRLLPEETLIVEDSPTGLLAADRSRSHVMRVANPKEVTYANISRKLKQIEGAMRLAPPKWRDDMLNVIIPMAGAGSRFEQAGYTFPKPLIEINHKPMIQIVTENLNLQARFIYLVRKEHREKFNLDVLLKLISPNCEIIEVDALTEGAACTTLLAKGLIDNENPLILANSDQFVEWDSNEFMYKMNESDCDGGILTFTATHPKWSFARTNEAGDVCEVAEKKPISNMATVGVYYWKHGSEYVKYADQMIAKNIRTNNEFYVCPVFNEAIQDGKRIKTFHVEKMWGLGTPEDLNVFLKVCNI